MRLVRRLLHVCKCGLVPISASLENRRRCVKKVELHEESLRLPLNAKYDRVNQPIEWLYGATPCIALLCCLDP